MAETVQILVPELGRSVTQARIRKWLKKVGDPVLAYEPVVAVDTDHATHELHAPVVGTLCEVTAEPGQVVAIGREIGKIARGSSNRKWAVYGSERTWRTEFPTLSLIATWLGWKR